MIRKGQALNFAVDETALRSEKRRAEEQFPVCRVAPMVFAFIAAMSSSSSPVKSRAQDLRHVHGGPSTRLLPRPRRVGVPHRAPGVFVGDALHYFLGFIPGFTSCTCNCLLVSTQARRGFR